jgi:hypothetical protein
VKTGAPLGAFGLVTVTISLQNQTTKGLNMVPAVRTSIKIGMPPACLDFDARAQTVSGTVDDRDLRQKSPFRTGIS